MGTYFTAVVNHNLDEHDVHTLPDLLNSAWHAIEHLLPIIEGYPVSGPSSTKWQWNEREGKFTLERLHRRKTMMVKGSEFDGLVSERVFRLCHAVRWWSFLTDQAVRDKLLRVSQHIASVLGSSQIIYLPDGFLKPEGALGLMYEGKAVGVEEMSGWLLENCGPPVQSVKSIYRGDIESWDPNGYYIVRI